MPAPLDPTLVAAITEDIRARELSRNAIARKHKVSGGAVTKIAKALELELGASPFDRSASEKAVKAAQVDAKAKRSQLMHDLYDDAQRFRTRAWEPYTQVITGPLGPEFVTTQYPPLRDQQAAYTSIGIAIDKATKLETIDDDGGAASGRTMVNDLFNAFSLAHARIVQEDTAAEPEA
jgi:hypothetical protein